VIGIPSGRTSGCGDGTAEAETCSFATSGCGASTAAVSCGRDSRGAPFAFGRVSSVAVIPFLFAKALSSFKIRSSHSPLSISPISSFTEAYLLSSSWMAATM